MQTESSPRDLQAPPYQAPRVYVVVVNWRGAFDTMECLESVFRMNYPNLRVVVCDNDSGDGSLQRIRDWALGRLVVRTPDPADPAADGFPPVSKPIAVACYDRAEAERGGSAADGDPHLVLIQTGANLGFAGGNNVALRYAMARGDAAYIWLLNNDAVVAADALLAMVSLAEEDDRLGMVGSTLLFYDHPRQVQAFAGGRLHRWSGTTRLLGRDTDLEGNLRTSSPGRIPRLDYITGASLLIRGETARQIGEMDESYFLYCEEVDWCLRAVRHGFALGHSADSLVWHKEGRSTGTVAPLREYYSVRSALRLTRKFFPLLVPAALVCSVFRSFLPKLVRLQPERFRPVLRAYHDFFSVRGPRHTCTPPVRGRLVH